MINPTHIRIAEFVIDDSNAVETLIDGMQRGNNGRRTNPNRYRLFLVGAFLTVWERGSLVVEDIHQTLTQDLPLDTQFRLGVRWWHTDSDGVQSVKVLSIYDLYNVSSRLSQGLAYGRSQTDLDDAERERRRSVTQQFSNDLMDVFDLGFKSTTYAIDATGIWSWGLGKKSNQGADTADIEEPVRL